MSLYNALHSINPFSGALLQLLNLSENDFGRFRDVRIEYGEDGAPSIIVHTRCGGGNREEYEEVFERMRSHKNYIECADCHHDSTYCDFTFSVPEEFKVIVADIAARTDNTAPSEKWAKVMAAMKSGDSSNPETRRVMEIGQQIVDKLKTSIENGDRIIEI